VGPFPPFGLLGRTSIGLSALSDQVLARDVRVQSDGRVVVLLSDRFTGNGGAIVRFSPGGALEGAIQWHGGADGPFAARALAIAPDGKFLVAGRSTPPPPLGAEDGSADVTVARFDPAALAPLPAPDLTATLKVRPPREIKYGSHGRATVVFQNIGTEPAVGWVNGTLNLRAADGTTPAQLNIIEQELNLRPGRSFTRRVRWSLEQGIPAGTYTFRLSLWSERYWESNDTNNVITGPPVKVARYFIDPSLESAAPAGPLVRGQPARVDAWVSNLGNRTSKQAFHLYVSLTALDGPTIANRGADLLIPRRALRSGERRPYSVLWDLPATLTPGSYRLEVMLYVISGYGGVRYNDDRSNDTVTLDVTLT